MKSTENTLVNGRDIDPQSIVSNAVEEEFAKQKDTNMQRDRM